MTNLVNTKIHTDIKKLIWIERFIPIWLQPYLYLMRIDRPIGIWLLLLPGIWGIVLATGGFALISGVELYYIILFIVGAIIMRSAGCIINDLWDRDLDKIVERTKTRPIASGNISVKQGILFLAILLLISFIILVQFNKATIILGFLAIPLIISYPLMKRITWWPQAFLGITFNFSALMGVSAVSGNIINIQSLLLYAAGIFWTLGYDTIYAHQDKEDDVMAGIKSTALKLGNNSKLWVSIFYALSIIFLFMTSFYNGLSIMSGVIILPVMHCIWQIKTWDIDDQKSSLKIFKSNRELGLFVLIFLLLN